MKPIHRGKKLFVAGPTANVNYEQVNNRGSGDNRGAEKRKKDRGNGWNTAPKIYYKVRISIGKDCIETMRLCVERRTEK